MQFEYYVLNYDFNKNEIENFNIFRNVLVQEKAEEAVKEYLRSPKEYKYVSWRVGEEDKEIYGFEGLCEEIRTILMWQLWSRCEYEIAVGSIFEENTQRFEKWDCYKQALPNIKTITRDIIYQYQEQKKKR